MYLPQAASLLPTIGAQPDLFRCMHLVWESWFEPTVAAFGTVDCPLHAQLNNSASVCRRGTGPCHIFSLDAWNAGSIASVMRFWHVMSFW